VSSIRPIGLRCEHLVAPLNVHRAQPRLSWMLEAMDASAKNLRQTAYQIVAGSTRDASELWDSGRVESADSQVIYGGKALASGAQCFWKVRAWDGDVKASDWSESASFEMGLLNLTDWKGRWIGSNESACPAPLFRKEFDLPARPTIARAYICGLGCYELYINGRRVGDHVLDPAQSDYETRALYVAYEVSEHLVAGTNAVGVILGKGWFTQDRVWGGMSYGQPRFVLQLRADDQAIVSDKTWKTACGPVQEDNLYAGETYDARREIARWNDVGCTAGEWAAAAEADSPTKSLEPQLMPPMRAISTIAPVKITRVSPTAHIFDMGQNFAGWVRLKARGKSGAAIRVRTAEAIKVDGTLDTASTGVFATNVEQIDTFVCAGRDVESYEPRFTYHGFRYAEVTGLSEEPTKETATGVIVHSDVEPIGTFECSDPMLNRIHNAAVWTLRSNLHGLPTDCPAREKCGWLGDAHTVAEMAFCNYDMRAFFEKYVRDIETSWKGELPGDVAPGKRGTNPNGNLDWGLAIVFVPWTIFLFGGDGGVLRDHYESMQRFMERAKPLAKDGIYSKGYGDWCPPGSVEPVLTPPALTTTAWFAHASRVMSRVARLLGKGEDEAAFAKHAEETRAAFVRKFFDPAKKSFGSQTANAMALELDLAPAEQREAIAANLNHDVMIEHKAHHTTGIHGSRVLFSALARHGYGAAALAVLRQTTYPSVGHLFSLGATTMWECWGEPELDAKWGARSQNHPMQAAFTAWFYHGLAGINPSPYKPGFEHVVLRPQWIDDPQLTRVRATYRSVRGMIVSSWERQGGQTNWHVELPPNTTASAYPPGKAQPTEIGSGSHDFAA
jgi:alpha-L-rhamnosidase